MTKPWFGNSWGRWPWSPWPQEVVIITEAPVARSRRTVAQCRAGHGRGAMKRGTIRHRPMGRSHGRWTPCYGAPQDRRRPRVTFATLLCVTVFAYQWRRGQLAESPKLLYKDCNTAGGVSWLTGLRSSRPGNIRSLDLRRSLPPSRLQEVSCLQCRNWPKIFISGPAGSWTMAEKSPSPWWLKSTGHGEVKKAPWRWRSVGCSVPISQGHGRWRFIEITDVLSMGTR